jgi:hypothetical protein
MAGSRDPLSLTKAQARRYLLAYHGLRPAHVFRGEAGILGYLRRVGCIQFDPLNIVGRNPDLVLQSRIEGYRTAHLEELLYGKRKLIDGWDKMMSIYPLEDWPFFRRRRESAWRRLNAPERPAAAAIPEVREALNARGPLSSIDLDLNEKVDWSWAPTRLGRAALESMYFGGELVVHHKVGTRKVYDFAHRHIPAGILNAPDPNPTLAAFQDWYVQRRIGGVGLLWERGGDVWLSMHGMKSAGRKDAIQRLLKANRLRAVRVEGVEVLLYARGVDLDLLTRSLSAKRPSPRASFLAPLDNLLWDRRLVEQIFDFSYRWEVYKPASEREYGYYVLPVLYGDRFVARFEPGRGEHGELVVKNWWWESGIRSSERMRQALRSSFQRFLSYLETDTLRIAPGAHGAADLKRILRTG